MRGVALVRGRNCAYRSRTPWCGLLEATLVMTWDRLPVSTSTVAPPNSPSLRASLSASRGTVTGGWLLKPSQDPELGEAGWAHPLNSPQFPKNSGVARRHRSVPLTLLSPHRQQSLSRLRGTRGSEGEVKR